MEGFAAERKRLGMTVEDAADIALVDESDVIAWEEADDAPLYAVLLLREIARRAELEMSETLRELSESQLFIAES